MFSDSEPWFADKSTTVRGSVRLKNKGHYIALITSLIKIQASFKQFAIHFNLCQSFKIFISFVNYLNLNTADAKCECY